MLGIFITKNAFTSHCIKLTFVLYLYCICIVLTLYLHRIWTILTLYLYCIWTLFTLYLYCICRAIMGHTMQGAFITPLWAITEDTLQGPSQLLCPSCFSFEVKILLGISSDLSHSKPRIIRYRMTAQNMSVAKDIYAFFIWKIFWVPPVRFRVFKPLGQTHV